MFDLDPQIAAFLIGGGVAFAIWAIASQAHEKSVVRDSLRALEDYEVESVRDPELLNPLGGRGQQLPVPVALALRVREGTQRVAHPRLLMGLRDERPVGGRAASTHAAGCGLGGPADLASLRYGGG